jgi:hypothetical protein
MIIKTVLFDSSKISIYSIYFKSLIILTLERKTIDKKFFNLYLIALIVRIKLIIIAINI